MPGRHRANDIRSLARRIRRISQLPDCSRPRNSWALLGGESRFSQITNCQHSNRPEGFGCPGAGAVPAVDCRGGCDEEADLGQAVRAGTCPYDAARGVRPGCGDRGLGNHQRSHVTRYFVLKLVGFAEEVTVSFTGDSGAHRTQGRRSSRHPAQRDAYSTSFAKALDAKGVSDVYTYMNGLNRTGNGTFDINVRGFSTAVEGFNIIDEQHAQHFHSLRHHQHRERGADRRAEGTCLRSRWPCQPRWPRQHHHETSAGLTSSPVGPPFRELHRGQRLLPRRRQLLPLCCGLHRPHRKEPPGHRPLKT